MNARQIPLDKVPLTDAEKEYLGPILDRWEGVQKEAQQVQKDIDAVIKLFSAQHKEELKGDTSWQLSRDAFVRPSSGGEEEKKPDSPNGHIEEDSFAELMAQS